MAAGYPVKVNYLTGDVLTAADLNDLAGTVNLYDPTAKGDLFPATAADAVSRLAVGANATVLTADSTTATGLKWAAAAAAGMESIAAGSLSGASVSITSINQTYKRIILQVLDYWGSAAGRLNLTFNSKTDSYDYNWMADDSSAINNNSGQATIAIGTSHGTTQVGTFMEMNIPNYSNTANYKSGVIIASGPVTSLTNIGWNGSGSTPLAAITSIQIKAPSGTWSGGTYILYGVN